MSSRLPTLFLLGCPLLLPAQSQPDLRQILERLDKLEEQNRALTAEIQSLRQQLATPAPAEKVEVHEQRIEELAQTRIASENHLPISLGGMLLFNAYRNGRNNGESMNPTTASLTPGTNLGGATVRQSVLGLRFQGPTILGGGKVSGSLFMDFFAGTGGVLTQQMRIRVASVDLAWKNTTLSFGQDKPLIAMREPESLAQVGVSPLTGAGNLWLWLPQARVEQRFAFDDRSGFKAQASLLQTSESGTGLTGDYAEGLSRARPALEARGEYWRKFGSHGRLEIAPGFHWSNSHVLHQQSVPTRIFAVDWLIRPLEKFDFSGTFFRGGNTGVLGGLRQGIFVDSHDRARAAESTGGYGQFTYRATNRVSFNLYGGQEDFRRSDLFASGVDRNQIYAANVYYRVGSNVITSFEASKVRTTYLTAGKRLHPHYDLAIAYIF